MCPAKPLRCRLLSLGGRHEATRVHHASRRGDGLAAGRACAPTASLARPGGNVTGFAVDTGSEIFGKRFELLKETLPNLSRVGILFNPDVAATRSRLPSMMEIAPTLGLTLVAVEARGLDALEQAF